MKIIRFYRIRKCRIRDSSPPGERGGSRSSRNAGRDAVDAGGVGAEGSRGAVLSGTVSDQAPCMTNGADAYGKSVWSWLSLPQSSFRGDASTPTGIDASSIRGATEARPKSSPGRARHKPSDHCAGKAGRFRLHLCFLCASLRISSAQRPWVPAGTRSSLRPLST